MSFDCFVSTFALPGFEFHTVPYCAKNEVQDCIITTAIITAIRKITCFIFICFLVYIFRIMPKF